MDGRPGNGRPGNGWATAALYRDKPSAAIARFQLHRFRNIALGTTAPYLVKGLIPRVGITALFGPPKCGKSFWLFDLMMHVAMGWLEYRGRRARFGPVVYCAFEGAEGFKARIEAFRREKLDPEDDPPFHLISARMSFARDHGDLIASIRAALGDEPPAAIVLDTLRRSLAGSESDDKDMSAYIDAADAVREMFECAIVVVHHSGLEGGRPRGSTALPGAVDAQLACTKDEGGLITVEVQLMKDGPEGERVISRLRQVDVGIDDDGDPITSLVVDEAEGAGAKSATKEQRLAHGAVIALRALHEAIDEHGLIPPAVAQIPPDTRCVTEAHWRAFAFKRGISNGERRARELAFTRSSDALKAKLKVGAWDDFVWPL